MRGKATSGLWCRDEAVRGLTCTHGPTEIEGNCRLRQRWRGDYFASWLLLRTLRCPRGFLMRPSVVPVAQSEDSCHWWMQSGYLTHVPRCV
jgi:hypothetical protein